MLADVLDLKGLANWLNIGSNDIETVCFSQAACYRRELIRRYCDRQQYDPRNPGKVAEDIAEALEQMDYKLQAQQLRELFSKTVSKHSGPLG